MCRLLVPISAVLLALIGALPIPALEVSGRVVGLPTNAPVPAATVRAIPIGATRSVLELRTDAQGYFSGGGAAEEDYRIEVTKPGYEMAVIETTSNRGPLLVKLFQRGAISGTVCTELGEPVAGAAVFALIRPAGDGDLIAVYQTDATDVWTQTDARGRYRLHDLPPGEFGVAAAFHGMSVVYPSIAHATMFSITAGEDYENVNLSIPVGRRWTLSGRVDGLDPGRDYLFSLVLRDQPGLVVSSMATMAGENFQLRGIPDGSYELLVSGVQRRRGAGDQVLFQRKEVDVQGSDISGINIKLEPGRKVSFGLERNAGATGKCPEEAIIKLAALEGWGNPLDYEINIQTGTDIAAHGLPPGRFIARMLRPSGECYLAGSKVVDLRSTSSRVTLKLVRGNEIHGTIALQGDSGAFEVVLFRKSQFHDPGGVHVAIPDADGGFSFTSLPPGEYRVAEYQVARNRPVSLPVFRQLRTVRLDGQERIDVELPIGASR